MNKLICAAAKEARMAKVLLCLGVAVATLGLGQAHAACNIRGEHCGRPAWAANAFSGPFGRAPESALEPPRRQVAPSSRSEQTYVKKVVRERAIKKVPPIVRFADDFGREFDPASNVWFDGKGQCWWGKRQFSYKDGDWFYGSTEWAEINDAWVVASGASPELVSCESVPTFAAKANAIAAKARAAAAKAKATSVEPVQPVSKVVKKEDDDEDGISQPALATPRPARVKTAEGDPASAPFEPAPASKPVCKRYFASVGQMIAVPCLE